MTASYKIENRSVYTKAESVGVWIRLFEFVDFSSVVLEMAVNMKWKDFEDAIQSATAEYVHADYIITRNIKDFTQSKVMEWLLLMKIAL